MMNIITQPYYTLDFSVAACNFEILVNDIPVITMESEGQISTNIPINYAIYKSGEQFITANIKPLAGTENLHPDASLKFNVRLYDVANNDFKRINDYEEVKLPQVEENQKVPFLTQETEFVAEIPYSLINWNNGENLKDVDDIKEKVIQAYNNLANLLKEEKYAEFAEKISVREKNMATSMYLTSSESKARINSLIDDAKNGFDVMPLPKSIFKFYGYGKLVTLKKLNGEPAFYLYNKETKEELMIDQMLYMPKGKTELEII
ncbi:hypothetical protein [Flavobacterium sp. MMS24-S5]|uniref:hypothetical protein n=1 Tax=Flavobacterium sp. MMS24-S5 TaxID=3416605 RepID=UPI003D03A236